MKPQYVALRKNHYSSLSSADSYVSREDVYSEIGHSIDELLKQDLGYRNTCAIRMSLALLKSGVPIRGRLKIKSGKYEGKYVEPGAKLLADQLSMNTLFGKPEFFKPAEALSKIKSKGVVFFWKIANSQSDHIDLIESSNAGQVCHSGCYMMCKEVWFWKLS